MISRMVFRTVIRIL